MMSVAVDRARFGRAPTLVQNVTYRWKGHSKGDKNLYRTREEIAAWQERDPIARFESDVDGTVTRLTDRMQIRAQPAIATRMISGSSECERGVKVSIPSEFDPEGCKFYATPREQARRRWQDEPVVVRAVAFMIVRRVVGLVRPG
jgi:hypothetical protein